MLSTIKNFLYTLTLCGIFFGASIPLNADEQFSPATIKALSKFQKLDTEILYGKHLSEKLLRCTYLQDAWLTYLHEAENQAEFLRGMIEIEKIIDHFPSQLAYAATYVNFFHPGHPRTLTSQTIELEDQEAFLNTYKKGRDLNEDERETFYNDEWSQYQEESISEPFELSHTTLQQIESGKMYNFALLPEGIIRIALEKPGGKDYLLNENNDFGDMAYPNHTILAGSASQPLLSAGAFIVYRVDDKQIIFISNKSGHYVPSYQSLEQLKKQLSTFGIDPHTVITVPTVELSDAVLSIYNHVQIPVSITQEDAERLFQSAWQRWLKAINLLDRQLLIELANGNNAPLTRLVIQDLNGIREEATYMRNAFYLYTQEHYAPTDFHEFVKRFGKLKDAIKHNVKDRIVIEAAWLCKFLQNKENLLYENSLSIAEDANIYNFVMSEIDILRSLMSKEKLSIDEFHLIKKSARELGSLFLNLSEDAFKEGQNFSIYQGATTRFLRVNQQMATLHDEQIGKILRGEVIEDEITLTLPNSIKNHLNQLLNQLGIAPPSINLEINELSAFWLINEAKGWYSYHYYISIHPDELLRGIKRQYDPKPKALLERLASEPIEPLTTEDIETLKLLKAVLRSAEVARDALIFIDACHAASPEVELYCSNLNTILESIERGNAAHIQSEANIMLKFMERNATPPSALETYRCSNQESYSSTIKEKMALLEQLDNSEISYEQSILVLRNVKSFAHLLDLYLLIGQKYQTLPTIAYEITMKDCERLVDELRQEIKNSNYEGQIKISDQLKFQAHRLLRKFM